MIRTHNLTTNEYMNLQKYSYLWVFSLIDIMNVVFDILFVDVIGAW